LVETSAVGGSFSAQNYPGGYNAGSYIICNFDSLRHIALTLVRQKCHLAMLS